MHAGDLEDPHVVQADRPQQVREGLGRAPDLLRREAVRRDAGNPGEVQERPLHLRELRVDRPQRTSSQPPSLYGFVPRTLCGRRVGALTPEAQKGDGDPLDICVLSERPIAAREILVKARVIGGLKMLDGGEADDKITAVLAGDFVWGEVDDIAQLPGVLIERLRHYFSTYKLVPGASPIVAASDSVCGWPQLVAGHVDAPFSALGTDGFGRSDTRAALRRHFEVDRHQVVLAALDALRRQGTVDAALCGEAIARYGIDADRAAPWQS